MCTKRYGVDIVLDCIDMKTICMNNPSLYIESPVMVIIITSANPHIANVDIVFINAHAQLDDRHTFGLSLFC
jgi:hypothetical protein